MSSQRLMLPAPDAPGRCRLLPPSPRQLLSQPLPLTPFLPFSVYSSLPICFLSCYLCPFLFSAPTLHLFPPPVWIVSLHLCLDAGAGAAVGGCECISHSLYASVTPLFLYALPKALSFCVRLCVRVSVSLCGFLPLSPSRCLFFFLYIFLLLSSLCASLTFFFLPCWLRLSLPRLFCTCFLFPGISVSLCLFLSTLSQRNTEDDVHTEADGWEGTDPPEGCLQAWGTACVETDHVLSL